MRRPVNKARSARKFRSQVKRTAYKNVVAPGRTGYRL